MWYWLGVWVYGRHFFSACLFFRFFFYPTIVMTFGSGLVSVVWPENETHNTTKTASKTGINNGMEVHCIFFSCTVSYLL